MSRGCQEGVKRVSGRCLHGVRRGSQSVCVGLVDWTVHVVLSCRALAGVGRVVVAHVSNMVVVVQGELLILMKFYCGEHVVQIFEHDIQVSKWPWRVSQLSIYLKRNSQTSLSANIFVLRPVHVD